MNFNHTHGEHMVRVWGDEFTSVRFIVKVKVFDKGSHMNKTTAFDPANYLDNADVIAEYIHLALASGDSELLLSAIEDVEKAKGQAQININTDVGRESR